MINDNRDEWGTATVQELIPDFVIEEIDAAMEYELHKKGDLAMGNNRIYSILLEHGQEVEDHQEENNITPTNLKWLSYALLYAVESELGGM